MEQDVNNEHFLHDIESISVTHLSPDSPRCATWYYLDGDQNNQNSLPFCVCVVNFLVLTL